MTPTLPMHTLDDIRALKPCYDPARYAPEDWQGTALDVLRAENVPAEDRLWVVLREEWIDARTLRLFAVRCARLALARVSNPDPRSVAVCDTAERYANGEATDAELAAARTAAWDAAWAEDRAAACFAARTAAGSAARTAAGSAAGSAARTAAGSAAGSAAMSAAGSAAGYAEYAAQVNMLIEMLGGGG